MSVSVGQGEKQTGRNLGLGVLVPFQKDSQAFDEFGKAHLLIPPLNIGNTRTQTHGMDYFRMWSKGLFLRFRVWSG